MAGVGKKPRRQIMALADAMEAKLVKHDEERGEHGWRGEDVSFLLSRLNDEIQELESSLGSMDILGSKEECADVANFAMMIFDRLGDAENKFREALEGEEQ